MENQGEIHQSGNRRLTYYLYSLGIVPLFMSRAFLPLFASAISGRYVTEWGWLAEKAGIDLIGGCRNG